MDRLLDVVTPQMVTLHPPRHFLAVFFLSFMWGLFGADRFYLGKVGTGIAKLVTFGGCGLWAVTDLVSIMSGRMRDKQNQPMIGLEYQKMAARIVLIFGIMAITATLVVGVTMAYVLSLLPTTYFGGGSLENLLPGGTHIPLIDDSIL